MPNFPCLLDGLDLATSLILICSLPRTSSYCHGSMLNARQGDLGLGVQWNNQLIKCVLAVL
jgi:hypothetical protein